MDDQLAKEAAAELAAFIAGAETFSFLNVLLNLLLLRSYAKFVAEPVAVAEPASEP
jgi:hypothetical protein